MRPSGAPRPTAAARPTVGRPLLRRAAGLGVAAVALTAAGCSSGPSSTATTRPRASTSTSTTRAAPTTTPSTTHPGSSSSVASSPSTTAVPPSGPTRCPTADLAGSVAGSSGAAGTIQMTIALRSTAPSPCTLFGYPGLQLLAGDGSALPTNVVRKGGYPFTAMAPTTVTLAPGQTADFNLGYSDVPVGGETSCPTATSMEVTPPNATDHLVVPASLAPCGGGTVVVSPVFAQGTNTQTTAPPG